MRRILVSPWGKPAKNAVPSRARGIYRARIGAAVVMLGLLMCGALAIAAWSHGKASRATAEARNQRQDTFAAEEAAAAFWQERETMAERLAFPRRAYLGEVRDIELRFRVALGSIQPDSAEEGAMLQQATDANDGMIAIFTGLLPLPDAATNVQGARSLRSAERSVLAPITRLMATNRRKYLTAEGRAGSAERAAYRSEIATSLLGLVAVIWFAIFATRLVRRIGKQNAELQLADLAKDEFINTVSHELRTPLTSMHGFVEMLLDDRDDPLSEQQRHFVSTVQRGSIRLERLVNDLLLTAQLREGPLDLRVTNTDLVEIARESVADAQAYAAHNALQLTLADPSSSILIEADVVRIGQALDNMISNAVKFTPAGGRIEVTLRRDSEHVTLTVSDTGMGMTAAEIERLFEPFFRTNAAQAQQIQGTGLGLPIVKAIVEAHHGTIDISSEPNVGTEISITLPLALPHGARAATSQMERLVAA